MPLIKVRLKDNNVALTFVGSSTVVRVDNDSELIATANTSDVNAIDVKYAVDNAPVILSWPFGDFREVIDLAGNTSASMGATRDQVVTRLNEIFDSGSGDLGSLKNLVGISMTNPQNGDVLVFNASAKLFENNRQRHTTTTGLSLDGAGVLTLTQTNEKSQDSTVTVDLSTLGGGSSDNMATADLTVSSARNHTLNAGLDFVVAQGGDFTVRTSGGSDRIVAMDNGVKINNIVYPSSDGTSGQFLSTKGSGVLSFQSLVSGNDNATVSVDNGDLKIEVNPKYITETVKNVSGATLTKGTPVHVTGSSGNAAEVIAADAATNYPAHFVLNEDIADDVEGDAIAVGFINNVSVPNASIYTEGQTVYLGASGGWVTTKPTGTNAIQNLGVIINVNTSANTVSGIVMGAGRSNDVPNIPNGQTWIGNASGVATPTTLADVATSGAYSDLSGTPSIPVSGVDFDPVGTDNSTDVTLSGIYDYIRISGQTLLLNQVDYNTDIANTPSIPTSGVDFDPVGTDNSTDVSINANAGDVLSMGASQVLGSQDAGADKLVFWDDSEGKLTYATIGTNLTMTADTLSASGGGGSANMSQSFTAPTNIGEFQDGARLITNAYGTAPAATAGTLVSFGATNVTATGAQSNAAAATGMLTVVTDAASGDELLVEGVIKLSTATTTTLLPTTTKKGTAVYMSTTDGAVTNTAPSTAGDFVRVVGHVVDATNRTIYFKPDNTWLEL
jgi:hypothetical protein